MIQAQLGVLTMTTSGRTRQGIGFPIEREEQRYLDFFLLGGYWNAT